jgi:hypothetical protein
MESEKICRICLEPEDPDDLFSPCLCSGTQKYVHKKCLIKWRNQDITSDNFKRCNECRTEYIIVDKNKPYYKNLYKIAQFIDKSSNIKMVITFIINILLGTFFLLNNPYDDIYYILIRMYYFGTLTNLIISLVFLIYFNMYNYCYNRENIQTKFGILSSPQILYMYSLNILILYFFTLVGLLFNFFLSNCLYKLIFCVYFDKKFAENNEVVEYTDNIQEELTETSSLNISSLSEIVTKTSPLNVYQSENELLIV